jgi:hypothetical protein
MFRLDYSTHKVILSIDNIMDELQKDNGIETIVSIIKENKLCPNEVWIVIYDLLEENGNICLSENGMFYDDSIMTKNFRLLEKISRLKNGSFRKVLK